MPRLSRLTIMLGSLLPFPLFSLCVRADEGALKDRPITTAQGKVGDLLRQWWQQRTAAGNVGDFYDNRDGGHSDLNVAPYPQLQKIVYSSADIKARRHWAAQPAVLPHVTFGNSSTSAPPTAGGSNPRMYYVSGRGLDILHRQYVGNNLYIYPEHRDHDPGHNGPNEGFGDLYPTNTPYLLISQGSSGSDQPFMRALPWTLAAFRPEVKKKLFETGLLMPTLQMLLRSTNKHLKTTDEYLTAKAHPTVFEGSWVNDLGLIQAAHAIELDKIPPLVQLKVTQEETPPSPSQGGASAASQGGAMPQLGRDFFEPGGSERLADTPQVVARIFRGKDRTRRLVVSAEGSFDVNKRPLTYTWVVLRGDPERITITPRNADRSVAEIMVAYHERRPIAPGSPLESNRVDIGVFVHNGVSHSAPAFITFFTLDSESRTYDKAGRILEMGYGLGETRVSIGNWPAFFKAVVEGSAGMRYLEGSKELREVFADARPRFLELHEAADKARLALKVFQEAKRDDTARRNELQKRLAESDKVVRDFLTAPRPKASLQEMADKRLRRAVEDAGLYGRFRSDNPEDAKALATYLALLERMGLVDRASGNVEFQYVRPGGTVYEKMLLERANAALLDKHILPGLLTVSTPTNFVDQRLTATKVWRDLYRYDDKGHFLGWTRHGDGPPRDFNPDGHVVLSKDDLGRCRTASPVKYAQEPLAKPGLNLHPLRWSVQDEVLTYAYSDRADFRGKIAARAPRQP